MVLFLFFIAGCSLKAPDKLSADDHHFAAFYAEYLARSGTTDNGNAAPWSDLTSSGLDTLFTRHKLSQKAFDARLQAYSRNPELWRKVLQEVRRNLDKQQP